MWGGGRGLPPSISAYKLHVTAPTTCSQFVVDRPSFWRGKKEADCRLVLTFTASSLRGHLAVGHHLVPKYHPWDVSLLLLYRKGSHAFYCNQLSGSNYERKCSIDKQNERLLEQKKFYRTRHEWPLTLRFDRATGLFLEFDMRHGAYRHEKKYYRHDIGHSLNSTGYIKPFYN